MATNKIKDLEISLDEMHEMICEKIAESIEELSLSGIGDEGNSEYEVEGVSVAYKNGKFIANIDLQRIEGRFVSNQELEDELLSCINGQTVTIEVGIGA